MLVEICSYLLQNSSIQTMLLEAVLCLIFQLSLVRHTSEYLHLLCGIEIHKTVDDIDKVVNKLFMSTHIHCDDLRMALNIMRTIAPTKYCTTNFQHYTILCKVRTLPHFDNCVRQMNGMLTKKICLYFPN